MVKSDIFIVSIVPPLILFPLILSSAIKVGNFDIKFGTIKLSISIVEIVPPLILFPLICWSFKIIPEVKSTLL